MKSTQVVTIQAALYSALARRANDEVNQTRLYGQYYSKCMYVQYDVISHTGNILKHIPKLSVTKISHMRKLVKTKEKQTNKSRRINSENGAHYSLVQTSNV